MGAGHGAAEEVPLKRWPKDVQDRRAQYGNLCANVCALLRLCPWVLYEDFVCENEAEKGNDDLFVKLGKMVATGRECGGNLGRFNKLLERRELTLWVTIDRL